MKEFKEQLPVTISRGQLDKQTNTIRGVAVLNTTSHNSTANKGKGRTYTENALSDVATLVSGKKAFADHASESEMLKNRGVRSIKDMFGFFEGGKVENGKVYANLVYLKNHASWVEPLVEQAGSIIGLSIHAFGESHFDRESQREIVENVKVLQSVDLVTEPGSTANLFESKGDVLAEPEVRTAEFELAEALEISPKRPDHRETLEEGELREALEIRQPKHEPRKMKELHKDDQAIVRAATASDY
jgi:hypothetical protein